MLTSYLYPGSLAHREVDEVLHVWLYWEDRPGRVKSPYLDLCLETIRRHAPSDPKVLDYHSAFDYVDLDARRWEALGWPNFRSDYLRSRLLHEHGGLWIDIDTIAVAPLERLADKLREYEVVAFGREVGRVYPGIMAAVAGAAPLAEWMVLQDQVVDEGISEYGAVGMGPLTQLTEKVGMWPLSAVAPVMWWEWRRFTSYTESPGRILGPGTTTVSLWNKGMSVRFGGLSRGRLMAGQNLLSRLLRVGLGLSEAADEENFATSLWPLSRMRFSSYGRALEDRVRGTRGSVARAFED